MWVEMGSAVVATGLGSWLAAEGFRTGRRQRRGQLVRYVAPKAKKKKK